jgi:hypothetical protein
MIVGVAAIFTLARFSEAFLLLRAQSVGLPIATVPMVLVVMNIVYTLTAWPAGALSDRLDDMVSLPWDLRCWYWLILRLPSAVALPW